VTQPIRHALITGAASGLGQAVAVRLSHTVDRLSLWDMNEVGLAETLRLCRGPAALSTRHINLADGAAVEKGFAEYDEDRVPDLIFHAAGILQCGDFEAVTAESCRQLIDVNYMGTVHMVLHGARAMRAGGRILCMASIAGLKGFPEFAAYCASKFAVVGFCESLYYDLQQRDIALSVVCPPAIDTPMVRNLASRPVLYDVFPFAPKAKVVDMVLNAVDQRKRFLILVDAQSKLLQVANGIFPQITSALFDRIIAYKKGA
jgi:NAD(P)-dependent dehydrogenase (short-subunit alcohol dehydrogenase family)